MFNILILGLGGNRRRGITAQYQVPFVHIAGDLADGNGDRAGSAGIAAQAGGDGVAADRQINKGIETRSVIRLHTADWAGEADRGAVRLGPRTDNRDRAHDVAGGG